MPPCKYPRMCLCKCLTAFFIHSPPTGCDAPPDSGRRAVAPCVCDLVNAGWTVGGLPGRSAAGVRDQSFLLAPYQTRRGLHSGTGTGRDKRLDLCARTWSQQEYWKWPLFALPQDTLGGRFDASQSFVGEMSDLHMWSHVLTASDISSLASCGSHLQGDVIAWSNTELELRGGVSRYPFDHCHWEASEGLMLPEYN